MCLDGPIRGAKGERGERMGAAHIAKSLVYDLAIGPTSLRGGVMFPVKLVVLLNSVSNSVSLSLITSLIFFNPAPGLM